MIGFKPWSVQPQIVRQTLIAIRDEYRLIHQVDDAGLLEAALATYYANRLPGAPVWLLMVGPASSGKTVTLSFLQDLPFIHEVSTITEASLLSGTPGKEKAKNASGGLLKSLGGFGIFTAKDFTSLLSMAKDKLTVSMAALREIYDGSWKRDLGVDGGRSECWKGKLGFIGCVTECFDEKHEARQQMGERFLLRRVPSSVENSLQVADRALSEQPALSGIRILIDSLNRYFEPPDELPELPQAIRNKIKHLSFIASRGRSAVPRNGYTREVESLPEAEEPARLAKQLRMLFFGFLTIGCAEEEAWIGVRQIGLDSMPPVRKRLLLRLFRSDSLLLTSELSSETKGINKLTIRALEELSLFSLVHRTGESDNCASWGLADVARKSLRSILDEIEEQRDQRISLGMVTQTEKQETDLLSSSPKHEGKSRSDSIHHFAALQGPGIRKRNTRQIGEMA